MSAPTFIAAGVGFLDQFESPQAYLEHRLSNLRYDGEKFMVIESVSFILSRLINKGEAKYKDPSSDQEITLTAIDPQRLREQVTALMDQFGDGTHQVTADVKPADGISEATVVVRYAGIEVLNINLFAADVDRLFPAPERLHISTEGEARNYTEDIEHAAMQVDMDQMRLTAALVALGRN